MNRNYLLILLGLLQIQYISAQYNLVPNPGFEEYNLCPSTLSSIWFDTDPSVKYWYTAGMGTSDYFNACADPATLASVPENEFSLFQPAHNGSGYTGFFIDLFDNDTYIYREYCQAQFTEPLTAGVCYYVEFWCAPSTKSEYAMFGFNNGTSDAVGAFIGYDKLGDPTFTGILPNDPQIDNNGTGAFIDPPEVWTKISGIYTALGGEDWITIGNFHPDGEVECIPYTGGPPDIAPIVYFFLDDVLVTPLDSIDIIADTISCSPIMLNAVGGGTSYLWSTGETTSSILASTSGEYWVTIELPCGTITDSAFVDITSVPSTGTNTTLTLCSSDLPYTLNADPGFTTFLWNTGVTTSSIDIISEGIYVLTETVDCTTQIDSFFISIQGSDTEIFNSTDTVLCLTSWSITLAAPDGYDSYTWNTGDETQTINVAEDGMYAVSCESICGTTTDSILIMTSPAINSAIDLGPDQSICDESNSASIILTPSNPFPEYQWSTGETSASIFVTQPGIYYLQYTDECGSLADTIEIHGCGTLVIPNAFSPNGDGLNDVFNINPDFPIIINAIQIYNRWGEMVFNTSGSSEGWDGTYKGQPQEIGMYSVQIIYSINSIQGKQVAPIYLIR